MSKSILYPDATYLELYKPGEFQNFLQGLIEILKGKLQRINVYVQGSVHHRQGDRVRWH